MGRGRAAHAVRVARLVAVVGLAAVAGRGRAGTPPFDFTGHWIGTVEQEGQSSPLTADLTSSGPKTFTGTVVVDETCTVTGKAKRHMKVALRVTCSHSGSIVKVRGRLDPATATMQGNFTEFRQRRVRHRGTVTLTRQAAGSQASGHARILHG